MTHFALNDRTVRSLVTLENRASTTRVLNLVRVWKLHGESPEHQAAPFFKTAVLNRSIIVKHRLRADERGLFPTSRSIATKVILPLDITNLRAGARSFLVDQIGFEEILNELGSGSRVAMTYDRGVMASLNRLPSLDPFLTREQLRRDGFTPARLYFDISAADLARIQDFARQEVSALVAMSGGHDGRGFGEKAMRLATLLLTNERDSDFEPLRQSLGLDEHQFMEGMFCWKGFIYYKWRLADLLPQVDPIADEIEGIRASGPVDSDTREYIERTRALLAKALRHACETVRLTLRIYDDAYDDLTKRRHPMAFKQFLLDAPSLFFEVGERLGAVEHILSFWRYRFPADRPRLIGVDELVDLFLDFEASINLQGVKLTI